MRGNTNVKIRVRYGVTSLKVVLDRPVVCEDIEGSITCKLLSQVERKGTLLFPPCLLPPDVVAVARTRGGQLPYPLNCQI